MKPVLSHLAVVCTLVPVCLAAARPAKAQPVLERLEQRIRNRLNQPPTPPAPAEVGAAQAAGQGAPRNPATGEAAGPAKEPGYVGIIGDDRNDRGRGVRVLEVRPDGPAAKAGLLKDDLITGVAGVRVRQLSDMIDVLELFAAGDVLSLDVLRAQQAQTIKVTLAGRPPPSPEAPAPPAPTAPPPPQPSAPAVPPPPAPGPPVPGSTPTEGAAQPASAQLPVESPAEVPPAQAPAAAGESQSELEALRQRIEQLERRVAELEKALAEALDKK